MSNPPRIWLDYRPVRIGWIVSGQNVAQLATVATWNACLWGGRHNCIIPIYDQALADRLVTCFDVDILMPAQADAATAAFIERFPHLKHDQWQERIFRQRGCEFADIRHAMRRIVAHQDKDAEGRIAIPSWDANDALGALLTLQLGCYPSPNNEILDYKRGVEASFKTIAVPIPLTSEIPSSLLDYLSPFGLADYGLSRDRVRRLQQGPGIVLGSVNDFDALAMFWNLRAAGAPVIFYDQAHDARLKPFANAFLGGLRTPDLSNAGRVTFWIRSNPPQNDDWRPDLDLTNLSIMLADGRGDIIWNGLNIEPSSPTISAWHRDVVPSYTEGDGKASASFPLLDRPFDDDDTQALSQKFAVIVDAAQYGGPDTDLTFETPYVPHLNEFYGRNFYHDYDAARSQAGRFGAGAIAIITSISTERLEVRAFRVFEWMKAFFALCGMTIERSEAGLRCSRLIAQLGGLQDGRVLKIRGVRALLRKYGVDEHFTRSGAITALRDVDEATGAVGFEEFKRLHIEYRESGDLTPDDVLRYLLERRVFRAGLEFKCPNCQLRSWMHIDDVKTRSTCNYCDHNYDVTPQLKDRDWRYRRSGIFGREDNQLGGVPVALTLQQLGSVLRDRFMMYSTAINFHSVGATMEPCESDFVGVVAGSRGRSESTVQIIFGETKSEGPFDAQDVRKLSALADAVPVELAEVYIMFSKTGTFSSEEIELSRTLNTQGRNRVILWSHDELEPFYPYERSKDRLGDGWLASSLTDLADVTRRLYFSQTISPST